MRAVFRTDYPIPELAADAGSLIVVRDPYSDYFALVIHEFGEGARAAVIEHLPHLTLVSFDGPLSSPAFLRHWLSLRRRPRRGPRDHLRVI